MFRARDPPPFVHRNDPADVGGIDFVLSARGLIRRESGATSGAGRDGVARIYLRTVRRRP